MVLVLKNIDCVKKNISKMVIFGQNQNFRVPPVEPAVRITLSYDVDISSSIVE